MTTKLILSGLCYLGLLHVEQSEGVRTVLKIKVGAVRNLNNLYYMLYNFSFNYHVIIYKDRLEINFFTKLNYKIEKLKI